MNLINIAPIALIVAISCVATISVLLVVQYISESSGLGNIVSISWQMASSHDYDFEKYNCEQFSRDLATRLNESGVDVCLVHGYLDGKDHMWVAAWQTNHWYYIEATTGTLIPPEDLGTKYTSCRERWECF